MTVWPACSIRTDTRRRLSRESLDVHVSQSQAIEGTPVDVPVPKNVSFIRLRVQKSFSIFPLPFVVFHSLEKGECRERSADEICKMSNDKWKMNSETCECRNAIY